MENRRYQHTRNHAYISPTDSADRSPARRGIRAVSVLAVALCALALFMLGVDYLMQPQQFPMKHISVEGELRNTQPSQVQKAIAEVVSSSNILRVDISKAVAAAQALPWVENATVNRKWPDTLEVHVNERVVQARWNDDMWLDQSGVTLELPEYENESLPRMRGGSGAGQEVLAKYRTMERKFFRSGLKILELSKSERDSWEFQVQVVSTDEKASHDKTESAEPSIRVILGSADLEKRSDRFLRLYSELFHSVADQISIIDMRYPDGISVRWVDQAPRLSGVARLKNS